MALGNGTHDGADGEAVEIVIDEDKHAKQHGEKLSGAAALNSLLCPTAEGFASAALVHQIHHYAQDNKEHDYTHVVAVRQHGYDTVISADQSNYGIPGPELGVEQSAHQAAKEQGRINLLAYKCKHDSYDRRQQRPERCREGRCSLFTVNDGHGFVFIDYAKYHEQYDEDSASYKIGNLCTFLLHIWISSFFICGNTPLYRSP